MAASLAFHYTLDRYRHFSIISLLFGKWKRKARGFRFVAAGRKKRLPDDAKAVSLSLGGAERIILSAIEVRRRQRGERGETSSQIVADALWHYLDCVEKVPREDINKLLIKKREEASNLKAFPKRD